MKIVIIIPAHNEEKTVYKVVKEAGEYGKVIVVNDASTDSTELQANKARALVITHKKNTGLGGALRSGFSQALKMNADIIITLDSDGQHLPSEIPRFVSKIMQGYDFVLGQRNLTYYPLIKKIGNFFLNAATNMISGTNLKDTESGYRAFSNSALKKLDLKADRYEIAAEIIKQVGKNKLKTANVPITIPVYVKGVGVKDGIHNFLYILRK